MDFKKYLINILFTIWKKLIPNDEKRLKIESIIIEWVSALKGQEQNKEESKPETKKKRP